MSKVRRRFIELVDAAVMSDESEGYLGIIERGMNNLFTYVARVYEMETQIIIARARLEGDELRERIMDLDRRRRLSHEAAISSTAQLVRMADNLNVAPIFEGDSKDRDAVGLFCGIVVLAFFADREHAEPIKLKKMIEIASCDDDFEEET